MIVIEGKDREELKEEKISRFCALSIEEHVKLYTDQGMELKDAMKKAAKDRGTTKREIYSALKGEK